MFRLLGLLGGLSVATDLGTGAPVEESLKRALVATRLARAIGCSDEEIRDVLYASLLQHLGCTAYAHESAAIWGDDIIATRLAFQTDFTTPRDIWRTWIGGIATQTGTTRAHAVRTTLVAGKRMDTEATLATCEVARDASRRLGLSTAVQDGLFHVTAMWNGKGYPAVGGQAIPLCTRVLQVASVATLVALNSGWDAAIAHVCGRAGTYLDPVLADAFAPRCAELLGDLDEIDAQEGVLDAEPDPARFVDAATLATVARTFGDLVDLKSPWFHGHSAAVAELAAGAIRWLALGEDVETTARIAGHLHDLGRIAVSSRIWDKPRPSNAELDQARLHPYHGERVLARIPMLAEVATLVGQHHERCDGSGYYRGVGGAQLSMPSRVLAAADAYRCLLEGRPGNPALPAPRAAERLTEAAAAGRLDEAAVTAVLRAGGLTRRGRRALPLGLTPRQVEVLRLVSQGLSNREIARLLTISARTAEHHVQDIYTKIGTTSRAGAALFAMEHGLIEKPG